MTGLICGGVAVELGILVFIATVILNVAMPGS